MLFSSCRARGPKKGVDLLFRNCSEKAGNSLNGNSFCGIKIDKKREIDFKRIDLRWYPSEHVVAVKTFGRDSKFAFEGLQNVVELQFCYQRERYGFEC